MPHRLSRLAVLSASAALTSLVATPVNSQATTTRHGSSHKLTITTLSVRADLVSGKSVLTKITLPSGGKLSRLKITLDGKSVRAEFKRRHNGDIEGHLGNLKNGKNKVVARVHGERAHLTITDHPSGGPLFSGPQIKPWRCESGATNAKCKHAVKHKYYYLPSGAAHVVDSGNPNAGKAFRRYHKGNPPPAHDIATATTLAGVKVPFIVRQETGYLDRDQYRIATLFQPGKKWRPWAPQKQFAHRLVIMHGAGCDTRYGAGTSPDILEPTLLNAGFMLMSTALDNNGENCDLVTQAESLLMTKQRVIDRYGTIKWTIGSGCSGGSVTQQQVANAYPGIYQGITPRCSYPDAWSTAMEDQDYSLLVNYFEHPSTWSKAARWKAKQIDAVFDHPGFHLPVTFTTHIPFKGGASRSCPDVPKAEVFQPHSNPGGVKCDLENYMVNVFGHHKNGWAHTAWDNDGVQYGLDALADGTITRAEFVDLNSTVGGFNRAGTYQAARTNPDPVALHRAYRTGAVNSGNHMNDVAIIDLRGPPGGFWHDPYHSFAMRDRLMADFGTAANQVMWRGAETGYGDPSFVDGSIFAMNRWLAAVHADHSGASLAHKIIADKPADITDRCTDGHGNELPESSCDSSVPLYGSPRLVAGMPTADDILACQLQPMSRSSYPVTFTDKQWARLQVVFPNGVCNYNAPGIKQGPSTSWLTYQNAKGHVVYGGKKLGSAPHSVEHHD